MLTKIFPFLLLVCSFHCVPSRGQCDSCHKTYPDKINVHLLPSSHLEHRYRATFQQQAATFIDSVIKALDENPDRRYAYVQTASFSQWWERSTDDRRNLFKELVNRGRIEMVNGGWGENDAAVSHYQSIIDQFTLGLRAINETLGYCGRPRIGWSSGPFGQSKQMASIYALLGYDALFLSHVDYRDKEERRAERNTEFIWKGDRNHVLGDQETAIFATLSLNGLRPPSGFGWHENGNDEPIIDDRSNPGYNLKYKVYQFYNKIKAEFGEHRTNNYYVVMANTNASYAYDNMDKLIAGFKRFKPEINVIYSTPSCYVKAVNEAAKAINVTFSVKTDDFLPYANNKHSYWTGFYAARSSLKRLERIGNNYLQVMKQLSLFARASGNRDVARYDSLSKALAVLNTHNAIRGAQIRKVNQQLTTEMLEELDSAELQIFQSLGALAFGESSTQATPNNRSTVSTCLLSSSSRCPLTNQKEFTVMVYNPLSRPVDHYVRLPVSGKNFRVLDSNGRKLEVNVLPGMEMLAEAKLKLLFLARNLPPLGVETFNVTLIDGDVTIKESQAARDVVENFNLYGYYYGKKGSKDKPENRAFGPYVFRPSSDLVHNLGERVTTHLYMGTLVNEIHQTFNDWMKHVVRFYEIENHFEIEWMVGPSGKIEDQGIEIVSTFHIDGDFNNTFYTDSNGGGLTKRIKFHRESYQYTNEEPIAGNYYPVASRLVVRDEKKKLEWAILTDRAQGGTLTTNGLQLMILRNFLDGNDDVGFGKGVVARGTHYFSEATIDENWKGVNSAMQQIDIAQRKLLAPLAMVGDIDLNVQSRRSYLFHGLTRALPRNVQILTLEHLNENNTILLRLEHLFEKGSHSKWSQNAQVNLNELFHTLDVLHAWETSLGADRPIEECRTKFHWKTDEKMAGGEDGRNISNDLVITLRPYTIRTFVVEYKLKD